MDTLLSDTCLRFCVSVGMDLLNNITNFVANVIERVRQAVLLIPSCVGLHMRLEARGEEWFYGDYKLYILI